MVVEWDINGIVCKCSPSILYRWGFFWGDEKERYGKCNTIIIGKVAGRENAFLIQNAFPIIEKYLDHVHTIQGQPIVVHKELNKILNKNLQDVLAMYDSGVKLLFTNVQEIWRIMEQELDDSKKE